MKQRWFFFKNNKELESLDAALNALKTQIDSMNSESQLTIALSELYTKLRQNIAKNTVENSRSIFNVTEATLNLLSNLSKEDSNFTFNKIIRQFSDECNRIPVNLSINEALAALILALLLALVFALFFGALGVKLGFDLVGAPGAIVGGISMALLGTLSGLLTTGICIIERCPKPISGSSYLENDIIEAINSVSLNVKPASIDLYTDSLKNFRQ